MEKGSKKIQKTKKKNVQKYVPEIDFWVSGKGPRSCDSLRSCQAR